jgi:hypothetical protein
VKGGRDGFSAGTNCDGCLDFSRSDGYRVWIAGRVALDDDSPWNRRACSEQKKSSGLDNDDSGNFHPGSEILFHSYFDPCGHQNILSTSSPDRYRPPLALEA